MIVTHPGNRQVEAKQTGGEMLMELREEMVGRSREYTFKTPGMVITGEERKTRNEEVKSSLNDRK